MSSPAVAAPCRARAPLPSDQHETRLYSPTVSRWWRLAVGSALELVVDEIAVVVDDEDVTASLELATLDVDVELIEAGVEEGVTDADDDVEAALDTEEEDKSEEEALVLVPKVDDEPVGRPLELDDVLDDTGGPS